MKHCVLFFALIGVCYFADATSYYSQGALAPNLLSSWNTNRLGGGLNPVSFTNAGDEFIIQYAHIMYTSSVWTVGSPSSVLRIEPGGVLHATFSVLVNGIFEIQNGGIYYHDNKAAVTTAAGSSIFGGIESFAAGSNVEIRNWINSTTPLPASVNWGNLVINYTASIGGNWNQQGTLTNIQGNFLLKRTGTAGQDFRLTNNTNFSLTVGGTIEIEQAALYVKEGNAIGTTALVQVNGDLTITDGILNLGAVDFKPNNEFRFKGNLLVTGSGTISAQSEDPMLVANGSTVQSFYYPATCNVSVKVATGAKIKLSSPLILGSLRALVIAGTLNAGTNAITMNSGPLAVSGGFFRSSSKIDMKDGVCQVCQGNGSFSFTNAWCATTGDTGIIEFNTDTILFNRSLASALRVGAFNSKGKLFLSNNARVAFTGTQSGPFPNRGSIELTGNGTLSFDENSLATGEAFYNGNGGWLITGSPSGLQPSGTAGNIQVKSSRNYNAGGINSFEFKSSFPQVTGVSFPSTITGTLKVSNSHPSGLTLSAATTIATGGTLYLEKGLLNTNSNTLLLTLNRNSILLGGSAFSYINGPVKKIGEQNFTFHIGKSGRYSPVVINANGGGNASDVYTVEYFPGNPQAQYGNLLFQFITHISTAEYWLITGTASPRQIRFNITPYSGVTDFNSLVVGYFDGGGWQNLGNGTVTGTTQNGTIEVSALNYGPFTLASTDINTNPFTAFLPVTFTKFTAQRKGSQGILNWEVSTDTEADRFEILSSTDNRFFTKIATVAAFYTKHAYQFTDSLLQPGITYYRIRGIEKNNKTVLSKIASLQFQRKGVELISASPSIVSRQTVINIVSSNRSLIQLRVVDIHGRPVKLLTASFDQGNSSVILDLSNLAAGLYYIHGISNEGKSNVLRVIKE